jgi:hypothetical protein
MCKLQELSPATDLISLFQHSLACLLKKNHVVNRHKQHPPFWSPSLSLLPRKTVFHDDRLCELRTSGSKQLHINRPCTCPRRTSNFATPASPPSNTFVTLKTDCAPKTTHHPKAHRTPYLANKMTLSCLSSPCPEDLNQIALLDCHTGVPILASFCTSCSLSFCFSSLLFYSMIVTATTVDPIVQW